MRNDKTRDYHGRLNLDNTKGIENKTICMHLQNQKQSQVLVFPWA
jgi:hypothetical protein